MAKLAAPCKWFDTNEPFLIKQSNLLKGVWEEAMCWNVWQLSAQGAVRDDKWE